MPEVSSKHGEKPSQRRSNSMPLSLAETPKSTTRKPSTIRIHIGPHERSSMAGRMRRLTRRLYCRPSSSATIA